jgi:predicted lipoprotein with Yx(FWY)xxD motif
MRSRFEHGRRWAAPVLVAGAVTLVAACGTNTSHPSSSNTTAPSSPASASPASGSPATTGTVTIKTASTKIGTVLVDSKGFTVYWFAKDTPTMSNCTGTCTSYWPPVIGTPKAAAGTSLPHGFGTITRSNGQKQATYDGHPLYTYVSDTSPGATGGNGLNLSGGLWWAMTPSGSKPGAPKPAASSSSSSGGYGY